MKDRQRERQRRQERQQTTNCGLTNRQAEEI